MLQSQSAGSNIHHWWRFVYPLDLLLPHHQHHLAQVTKEGTEGAAATGVEIALFSAAFGEQKDIVVDRPFIFVVQDRKNKIPVLVGKITDPTKI